MSPDSTVYIDTARNLLQGKGLSVDNEPLTNFPPGYPVLLAATSIVLQNDVLHAARSLCIVLYGINLVLFGYAVFLSSGRNLLATVLAAVFFVFSPSVLTAHFMAWSEAPFVTFSLSCILLLSISLAEDRLGLLLASAVLLGCALMTRYAGIALYPPTVAAILIIGSRSARKRLRRVLLYSTVAFLPLLSWLARNLMVASSATNRTFALHPFDSHDFRMLVTTLWRWLLPIETDFWWMSLLVGGGVLVILAVLSILLGRASASRQHASSSVVFLVVGVSYFLTYLLFLVLSISFFDTHISINQRIMLPSLLILTIAGIGLVHVLSSHSKPIWVASLLLLCATTIFHVRETVLTAVDMHQNGRGYTARSWMQSEVIACMKGLPEGHRLYSNGPDVLRFLLRRRTEALPIKVTPTSREANQNYHEQMQQMIRECKEGRAFIAYLDEITWRWYMPTREELVQEGNPPVFRNLRDGVIYGLP